MAGVSGRPEITAGNARWSLSWLLRERRSNVSGWNMKVRADAEMLAALGSRH
jgi:hypothetical protein